MNLVPEVENFFRNDFQAALEGALRQSKWISDQDSLDSQKFLRKRILPVAHQLSGMFNRDQGEVSEQNYWHRSDSKNSARLAYALTHFAPNAVRMASVWTELLRLKFSLKLSESVRALDLGSGLGSSLLGTSFFAHELGESGSWSFVERDKKCLDFGRRALPDLLTACGGGFPWEMKGFQKTLNFSEGDLGISREAGRFNLWISSFFLNEFPSFGTESFSRKLFEHWRAHLKKDSWVIIVEPGTQASSRKLLSLRKDFLQLRKEYRLEDLQVVLPCLGEQDCGALERDGDWCHEEANWWRPAYLHVLDKMMEKDHKDLPFSYLVLRRGESGSPFLNRPQTARVVSPAHAEGPVWSFYVCGQCKKRRTKFRPKKLYRKLPIVNRGDLIEYSGQRDEVSFLRKLDLLES